MRGQPDNNTSDDGSASPIVRQGIERRVTQLPVFQNQSTEPRTSRVYGGGNNDGVWANLSAKPTRGEEVEEKPPVCTPVQCQTCYVNEC
jgi:hypothetical protein